MIKFSLEIFMRKSFNQNNFQRCFLLSALAFQNHLSRFSCGTADFSYRQVRVRVNGYSDGKGLGLMSKFFVLTLCIDSFHSLISNTIFFFLNTESLCVCVRCVSLFYFYFIGMVSHCIKTHTETQIKFWFCL